VSISIQKLTKVECRKSGTSLHKQNKDLACEFAATHLHNADHKCSAANRKTSSLMQTNVLNKQCQTQHYRSGCRTDIYNSKICVHCKVPIPSEYHVELEHAQTVTVWWWHVANNAEATYMHPYCLRVFGQLTNTTMLTNTFEMDHISFLQKLLQYSSKKHCIIKTTFPVLRSTSSWWVTTYVGKPSAVRQPTRLSLSSFQGR